MTARLENPEDAMCWALELAVRGVGTVEPNPPVGAVLVNDAGELIGEGWHEWFGGPHAEVNALAQAGERARGATLFVTLEPCCHFGKTPPCSRAIIAAGVRRVFVATRDPAPHVDGGGLAELRAAGIEVSLGPLADEAQALIAPFRKLFTTGLPFVLAKWAMTLDGKIATRTGHSRWISGEASRRVVHQIRGRMDAIVVGAGTALADDPLLTARPPGPRTACRVVVDSRARLPLDSQLIRTRDQAPVLLATTMQAPAESVAALTSAGVEILQLPADASGHVDLTALLTELGRRRMTNILVEGGGRLLGALFDQGQVDEFHVFVAPKLVGGTAAVPPLGGLGLPEVPQNSQLGNVEVRTIGEDVYIRGRLI